MLARSPALLALVLLVSGCTGGAGPASSAGASGPAVDEDSGALQLTVSDEEYRLLSGVLVGVPNLGIEATTDAEGRALLPQIPPGSHEVHANLLGYKPAAFKVDIAAGATLEHTLTLQSIPIEVARVERIPFTGRFECAITFLDIQWRECDSNKLVWPNSDNFEMFTKPAGVRQIVAELRWQAASAGTGQNLDYSIMQGKADRQGCQWYANDYGPSPIKLVVTVGEEYENPHSAAATGCDDTVIDPKDTNLMVKVHSSPAYVAGQATAGVTYGQKYDGFVSLFYASNATSTYTAFTDV